MYNATTSTLAPHADPRGGFTVLAPQQRRLHNHAHALGFADLGSYLRARCRQQASPAQLARELATTTTVVRRLLDQAALPHHPAG
jgi:hypothetical protein